MLQLCDALADFYPSEIQKIRDRVQRFDAVREHWAAREDFWA